MNMLCIPYPESIPALANQSAEDFEREARMMLALKLFETGRLTSGQAAMLADMPRVRFLLECPRYGVASVNWDAKELESEFSQPTYPSAGRGLQPRPERLYFTLRQASLMMGFGAEKIVGAYPIHCRC
ncbi:MAG: UPF0175 family protein [Gammaproteobacteria bacterium]|nr:UPF0175 family protein [Gammaproteobacteria bacterium]